MAYRVVHEAYLQFGNGPGPYRTVRCFECGETEDGRIDLKVGNEWDLRVRRVHGLPDNPWIPLNGEVVPVCFVRWGEL